MIDDSDFIFAQSLREKKCFCWCHTNTLGTILRRFPHIHKNFRSSPPSPRCTQHDQSTGLKAFFPLSVFLILWWTRWPINTKTNPIEIFRLKVFMYTHFFQVPYHPPDYYTCPFRTTKLDKLVWKRVCFLRTIFEQNKNRNQSTVAILVACLAEVFPSCCVFPSKFTSLLARSDTRV